MLKLLGYMRLIACLALLIILAQLAKDLSSRVAAQQVRKYDYASINHMKYSLFNVSLWKNKLRAIVVSEIQKFKIDDSNKEALKKHMEDQLDVLIDKVNEQIIKSNKDSTMGWFKQSMMDMLVDVQEIKKGIPDYADVIVDKLTSEETQTQLKAILKEKISVYMKKTYDDVSTAENAAIVERVGAANIIEAREKLATIVPEENAKLFELTWQMMALAVGLFFLAAFHRGRRLPAPYFFIVMSLLLVLLYVGVTSPMIDMDARIPKFGFVLLGYPIEFVDQTVYYQSKSILDVFWIMMEHQKAEMKGLGVLLILFSVVFPLLKVLFSYIYYYNWFGLQKNSFVKGLALYTGKWSMADVLAIAILMAYIGFDGMVTTQMESMRNTFPEATFISTNGTVLQIGLYVFVTYVVLSILFSMIISRTEKVS